MALDATGVAGAHSGAGHATVVDATLAMALTMPRGTGPGHEALITATQAARVRTVYDAAPTTTRAALERMLAALDGAGHVPGTAVVARALLLRGVAARSLTLVGPEPAGALHVLGRFTETLQRFGLEELKRRASALDLDASTNESAFDPLTLWSTRGSTSGIGSQNTRDVDASNDGLFQRFTGSCGPTTLQMMLAEADPVFAFALHARDLTSDATDDATAHFQRVRLEQHGGGKALGRFESMLRARVNNALGRLVRSELLTDVERAACRAWLYDGGAAGPNVTRALEALRARYGFPSDEDVARLRDRRWPAADHGIATDAMVAIVNDEHRTLGVRYEAREFGHGQVWRHLDDVANALRRGHDVPCGCSDPGHWFLLSAVTGRRPHREFLVSDPDGGRTLWVHERTLARGTFLADDLQLARAGQRPWVDTFLLPTT